MTDKYIEVPYYYGKEFHEERGSMRTKRKDDFTWRGVPSKAEIIWKDTPRGEYIFHTERGPSQLLYAFLLLFRFSKTTHKIWRLISALSPEMCHH
jgi:hypothetical protein